MLGHRGLSVLAQPVCLGWTVWNARSPNSHPRPPFPNTCSAAAGYSQLLIGLAALLCSLPRALALANIAQNYETRNFWPCLTCNIFSTKQHRKLKLSDYNHRVVRYKVDNYPFFLLISAEVTDCQTCDFFGPIAILTKFDSKYFNLPSNLFPLFSSVGMHPTSSMSLSEI